MKGQTAGTVHIEKKGAHSGHGQVGTGRGHGHVRHSVCGGEGDKTLGSGALEWEPECVSLSLRPQEPLAPLQVCSDREQQGHGWGGVQGQVLRCTRPEVCVQPGDRSADTELHIQKLLRE